MLKQIAAAVALLLIVADAATAQERPLRFGNVTGQLGSAVPAFRPLTDHLSSFLDGRPFEVVPFDNIERMIDAVDRNELDFVIATPVAFVTLGTRHRVRPIATITRESGATLSPWLAGAVFVKRDRADLRRLEDARGRRILALSPLALGGWLAARREWQSLGIGESDFASVGFDFSYEAILTKICAGDADIGVLPANILGGLRNTCPGGVRVLPPPEEREGRYPLEVSTRLYPEAAVVAVGDLDEELVTRVAIALLSVDPGSPAARGAAVSGFTAPLSYTPVQQLMEELHIGPYKSFGSLSFAQAMRQHAGKVMAAMLVFVSILLFAFVRARRLNARLAMLIAQWRTADDERRHLESQLQQSRRLESIGRVAGGVAHDFNNLLTVINGYSQILLMGPLDGERREEVQQIHKAGRRAAELTAQLLTFSRRQVTDVIPLDLNTVIHDADPLLRRLAGEDAHLTLSLSPAVAATSGDVSQMTQVLMNLVVNARDAMPGGGRIDIATENVTVPSPGEHPPDIDSGDYVVLTVTDTGTGMTADVRQHLFEPFFSTKGEAGTGLGLSTVYGIVRQRQGGITVWSEPGQGSRFRIYLPRTQSQPAPVAPVKTARAETPSGRHRILVVEDQDEVRGFATEVLRSAGYDVMEASTGEAALAALNQAPIDLLLTDVVLRGMNGRELAEQFSHRFPGAAVLFTSGYPDDVTAQKGVPRGSVAFLPKPYSPDALVGRIAELLIPVADGAARV